MTIQKAKLFKTAIVAEHLSGHKDECHEVSEYPIGEIVRVEFVAATGAGQFNFRISCPGKFPRVVSGRYLKDYCL